MVAGQPTTRSDVPLREGRRMSGWQRIGAVLSILWAIGAPTALAISQNIDASASFDQCLDLAGRTSRNFDDAEQRAKVYDREANACTRVEIASSTSITAAFQSVFTDDETIEYLIIAPILTMWLLGWVIITTVRRVRRGFSPKIEVISAESWDDARWLAKQVTITDRKI